MTKRDVDLIKYSNGVKKIHEGGAFYLPRRHYDGEGIFNDIIKNFPKIKIQLTVSRML